MAGGDSATGGVRVRAGRRADAVAVGALAAEFAGYLRALGDTTDFRFDATSFLRDGFGRRAAFHPLVAVYAGQVVGYALWHAAYDSDRAMRLGHVADLFVSSSRRGLGIGRALVTAVAIDAGNAGAGELWWAVYLPNRRVVGFYERLGARPIDDLGYMRLALSAVPGDLRRGALV